MIDKAELTDVINQALDGSDMFLVDVTVTPDNVIDVEIDADRDITIDDCQRLNDIVLAKFDRDVEDYELTIGSCGLTTPFKVLRQYAKNVGNAVEVLTADGRKLKGTLANAGDDQFTVTIEVKEKVEGKKRPQLVQKDIVLKYDEVKYTKNIIEI
ncbi:MAG: ribosome assembly cofactor RimP [Sodaliphilus sp.]|nr:ribosome assembly cofactor RimP [Sodaliphilus sp.]